MSALIAIRPIMALRPLVLMTDQPVTMEQVVAGPLRQLYEAKQLTGPVEIRLTDTLSVDGRLGEPMRSNCANDFEPFPQAEASINPPEADQVSAPQQETTQAAAQAAAPALSLVHKTAPPEPKKPSSTAKVLTLLR